MKLLTLNECSLVTGGLMPSRAGEGARRQRSSGREKPNMIIGPGSGYGDYGGGGYYIGSGGNYYSGTLGSTFGVGNYTNDYFFSTGSQYANTTVYAGDKITVTSTDGENTAQCVIERPTGTEIGLGVLAITEGIIDVAAGATAIIASDGLAAFAGGGELIAFGAGAVAAGALALEPHSICWQGGGGSGGGGEQP